MCTDIHIKVEGVCSMVIRTHIHIHVYMYGFWHIRVFFRTCTHMCTHV